MGLKLNGKPFSLVKTPKVVIRIRTLLDKSKADELLDSSELSKAVNCEVNALRQSSTFAHPELGGYSAKLGFTRYWGNPKAIAELLKQVGR